MKIEISEPVRAYIASLAPEPKRRLRQALRNLASGKGDLQPLEDDLAGNYRLRVGNMRVIVRFGHHRGEEIVYCDFAEDRSVVYQMYTRMARHLR